MKTRLLLTTFLSLCTAMPLMAGSSKNKIEFLEETLVLAHEEKNKAGSLREYIPKNQKLSDFEKMVAIYEYKNFPATARQAANQKLQETLARRNTGDPVANGSVFVKEGVDNEAIVDFVISQGIIYEHNVMFFKNKGKGIQLVKYVKRFYAREATTKKDMKNFFDDINEWRQKIIDSLTSRKW